MLYEPLSQELGVELGNAAIFLALDDIDTLLPSGLTHKAAILAHVSQGMRLLSAREQEVIVEAEGTLDPWAWTVIVYPRVRGERRLR